MTRNSTWILFSKYFAGECNQEEKTKIKHLVEKDGQHRDLFNRLTNDNEIMEKYKKMKTVNVDKAWDKVSERIQASVHRNSPQALHIPSRNPFTLTKKWIAIAASVLILAGMFFIYRTVFDSKPEGGGLVTVTSSVSDIPTILPDGSKVYLNRDSRITYPHRFSNKTREISLTGEAFFEVTADASHPFVVKAGNARVKVLGTSFSVNGNTGKNTVEIFVESGKVQIYLSDKENQTVMLEPGYVGRLSKRTSEKLINDNKNIIAWKTKKIVFSQTRLAEVLQVLEHVYGEKIRIENKEALEWPYTNTFDNQTFQSVIAVLAETFQFGVSKERSVFVLTGGIY
ncbi:MAG: FecR domain-containing protein [Bacteroidales bacterium]|nr:FecR domain-containing protein [Bacteroidales bacterium]